MRKNVLTEINQLAVLYYILIVLSSTIMRYLDMIDLKMNVIFDSFLYAYILPVAMLTGILSGFIRSSSTKVLFKLGLSIALFFFISVLIQYDPMLMISKVIMYVGILLYCCLFNVLVSKRKGS